MIDHRQSMISNHEFVIIALVMSVIPIMRPSPFQSEIGLPLGTVGT